MSKKHDLDEFINLMTKALRHKIGSIVNKNEFYASKYAKDFEILKRQAEKTLIKHKFNEEEKTFIKQQLIIKLRKELTEKQFIDQKKFEIMDDEINAALKDLNLD